MAGNSIIKDKDKEILALANFEGVFATQEILDYLKSDETKEIGKAIKKSYCCWNYWH